MEELFVDISDIIEEQSDEDPYVYDIELSKNHYFAANGIVSHNCRLISDSEMMDFAGQSNSFGGVGISLGSHRVITLNLARTAFVSKDMDSYYDVLDDQLVSAAKILRAHKELIKTTASKGLQPFITNGWINQSRLFSTFGIIGLVEAHEYAKVNFKKLPADFVGDVLTFINTRVAELSTEYGIIGNIEQIPAESMAVRLAKVDKSIFGEESVPYPLYANQFIPLWEEASIWEKLEADGRYNRLITGGGIVHAQIGEKVTPTQAKEIVQYAIKSGCEHFALNAVYSECENGHTSFGKTNKCAVCGTSNIDYFTRVVGFFTKVSNWNPTRREEDFPNRTFV